MQNVRHTTGFLQQRHDSILLEKWVIANIIAEVLSLSLVAVVSATVNMIEDVNSHSILLLLGIFKGIILGFAQWLVLRRYIRNPIWWVFATTLGALLGWLMILLVSSLTAFAFAFAANQLSTATLVIGVFILGALVGTVMGFIQGLVILAYFRTNIQHLFSWINANALAWGLALVVGFMGTGIEKLDTFSVEATQMKFSTGVTMGIVTGVITGVVLIYLSHLPLRGRHRYVATSQRVAIAKMMKSLRRYL
jgi:hypothetical protein